MSILKLLGEDECNALSPHVMRGKAIAAAIARERIVEKILISF